MGDGPARRSEPRLAGIAQVGPRERDAPEDDPALEALMSFALLSAILLLSGGCAQLETKAPQDVEFDLSGRLAARYGNEAFSGNLAWRHARSADEMLISSTM